MAAYRRGIFPWYENGQPLLWWTPDPRLVLRPRRFHAGRNLRRLLRRGVYSVSFDRCFESVIRACAEPRGDDAGTWITPEMIDAYAALHQQGVAHSVEVWAEGELAGGLYGIALGAVFFGESMFSRTTGASKIALHALCAQIYTDEAALIDCQVPSRHLMSLGAELLPRRDFVELLRHAIGGRCPWPDQKR